MASQRIVDVFYHLRPAFIGSQDDDVDLDFGVQTESGDDKKKKKNARAVWFGTRP